MATLDANESAVTDTPSSETSISSTSSEQRKVFVVLNPVAGLTDAGDAKEIITLFCKEKNWACDIHETQKDEDVTQLVKEMLEKGVDIVIAAGGDGTVSNVVAGMLHSEVPMAILPAGTGNNLARDLGIPLDLTGAMELLAQDHQIHVMDAMRVNKENVYLLNVSIGVSSLTMRTTRRSEKRRFGMLAYLYRAVGSLKNTPLHRFQVQVDDRTVRFSASELMIANSRFMGFQPNIEGLKVDPNDGRMDVFIVQADSLGDYINVFSKFIVKQKDEEDATLHHLEAHKRIVIESEFPLPVQADGEEIGNTPVEIELIPDAIRIIAPIDSVPAG